MDKLVVIQIVEDAYNSNLSKIIGVINTNTFDDILSFINEYIDNQIEYYTDKCNYELVNNFRIFKSFLSDVDIHRFINDIYTHSIYVFCEYTSITINFISMNDLNKVNIFLYNLEKDEGSECEICEYAYSKKEKLKKF